MFKITKHLAGILHDICSRLMEGPRILVTSHAFVDESFKQAYIVAAAVLPSTDVNRARGVIRGLLRPGQARLHFKKESNARRSQILDALETLSLRVRLYVAAAPVSYPRDACLERMIPDLEAEGVSRLVIERDESIVHAEMQMLYTLTRKHAPNMSYEHMRAREDPLLAAPDAFAWCWAKGGHWKARMSGYSVELRA